jgi:hypothetical protein
VAAVAVVISCASAQAGFVDGTFWCEFPDDPNQANHDWTFDYGLEELTLGEAIPAVGPDSVIMSGETNMDPTFHVLKDVQNLSGVEWTGYILTLTGTDVSFQGPAGSTRFNTVIVSPNMIEFYAPNPVPHGDSVVLDFYINVASTGLFEFTVTQNPIPEPATLGLLAIGGLAMLRRRR